MTGKKVTVPKGTIIQACIDALRNPDAEYRKVNEDLEGTLIDGTYPDVIVNIDGCPFFVGECILEHGVIKQTPTTAF